MPDIGNGKEACVEGKASVSISPSTYLRFPVTFSLPLNTPELFGIYTFEVSNPHSTSLDTMRLRRGWSLFMYDSEGR